MKIAIVGLGVMGRNHLRVVSEICVDETELVLDSVADVVISPEMEKYLDSHHPGVKQYKDYKKLLRNRKPDILIIATPTTNHRIVAMDAMEEGCRNIFIEKPIAGTLYEADNIIEVANGCGATISVGHIERFNPAIAQLKQEMGELGKIYKINVTRAGVFPDRISDTGVVLDLSVHDLDIIRYLLDEDIKDEVQSKVSQNIHPYHEDVLAAIVESESGVLCQLDINWVSPDKKRQLEILAEKGAARVDYITQELSIHCVPGWKRADDNLKGSTIYDVQEGVQVRPAITKQEPLKAELLNFLNHALGRDQLETAIAEDGRRALELALLILGE